jgi:Cu/Ag efflux protein CusF
VSQPFNAEQHIFKSILTALVFACLGLSTACGPSQSGKQPDAKEADAKVTGETQPTTVKRYALTGRVVFVDNQNQLINIDCDEVPCFMAAMKMPYPVKDASLLERVSPGDRIKAEIVVGSEGAYLENIVGATKAPSQTPQQ